MPILLSVIMEEVSLSLSYFSPGALSPLQHLFLLCFQKDGCVSFRCLKALSQNCLPRKSSARQQKRELWRFCQLHLNPDMCFTVVELPIKIFGTLWPHSLHNLKIKKFYSLPSSSASAFRGLPWVSFLWCLFQFRILPFLFSVCISDFMITPLFYSSSVSPCGLFIWLVTSMTAGIA